MITRGTTPQQEFKFPFEKDQCDKVRIIYSQDDTPVFKLEKDRLTFTDGWITCTLTQEETFMLSAESACRIQIRVLTTEGAVWASDPVRAGVGENLDDEVLK